MRVKAASVPLQAMIPYAPPGSIDSNDERAQVTTGKTTAHAHATSRDALRAPVAIRAAAGAPVGAIPGPVDR